MTLHPSGTTATKPRAEDARLPIGRHSGSPEQVFSDAVDLPTRKRRGQFFTPDGVAAAMVRWACRHRPQSFLDPAVGPGIFLEKLASQGIGAIRRIVAYDTDAFALDLARARSSKESEMAVDFVLADFLCAEPAAPFDAIVCNPPYIRHHQARLPDSLFAQFDERFNLRFSRLTNVYCLFLLKITTLLSPRGRAAVITPTEFLNADFGRAVKQVLLHAPGFLGFIVADYKTSLFDGLMTTATITLFDLARRPDDVTLARTTDPDGLDACFDVFEHRRPAAINDRDSPPAIVNTPRRELDPAAKWSTSAFHIAAT
ncbi:MAG: N-6 DNA methylase, partial [Phycisphaerae bacterium]